MRVKCLAQEHNAMTPARAQTWTAQSGDRHINHEVTSAKLVTSVRPFLVFPMRVFCCTYHYKAATQNRIHIELFTLVMF